MFSFYKVILDLLKARTHKYVRRVPIGSTHTGATKYKYYYQEQAGHGKGLGHESELVKDASFSFGEGENKYHAHIKSVDGDKLTIEYDDGDKKGQKETLSKTEFQNRIHKEHATSIKQAHEKAKKQLATFEKMKEKGAKVKDSTLNKLKAQVEKLDSLNSTNPEHDQKKKDYIESVKKFGDFSKLASSLSDGKSNKAGLRSLGYKANENAIAYGDIVDEINESAKQDEFSSHEDEINSMPWDSMAINAYKEIDHQMRNPEEKNSLDMVITRKTYDKEAWYNKIKPALESIGIQKFMGLLEFDKNTGGVNYIIPFSYLNKLGYEKASRFLKDTFGNIEHTEPKKNEITDSQKEYIETYNGATVKGFPSFIFEDGKIGEFIPDDDMNNRDPDKLSLYVIGQFKDKDRLYSMGFRWVQKKDGGKGESYYKYKAPVSKQ
jgi:hypothetical protein